jgi:hypothetical protein
MEELQQFIEKEPFLSEFIDDCPLRPLVYRMAVVLGLFQRHGQPKAEEAKAAVSALLSGEKPQQGFVETWMKSLKVKSLRELEEHACLVGRRLTRQLGLIEEAADGSEGWNLRVLSLMQEREQLEGILLLLQMVGRGGTDLDYILWLLDDDATIVFDRFPKTNLPESVLLRKAAIVSPEAWWTKF